MIKKITWVPQAKVEVFDTGRAYGPEGQIIAYSVEPNGDIVFADVTRGISGRVKGPRCPVGTSARRNLMYKYDRHEYDDWLPSEISRPLYDIAQEFINENPEGIDTN
tara:strand:+ start:10837 stop:11157 length:321 start_codon:yes stop_codon:yes gene_type:complete